MICVDSSVAAKWLFEEEYSDRFNLPATYDAHYLALAQMQAAILWTDDRKLLQALAGQLPFVSWIGDYPV